MASPGLVHDEDRIRYVQSVFRRVLSLEQEATPDDDFFVLGGTSLAAMEVVELIEEEQGLRIPVRNFYRSTVVRALALELDPSHRES